MNRIFIFLVYLSCLITQLNAQVTNVDQGLFKLGRQIYTQQNLEDYFFVQLIGKDKNFRIIDASNWTESIEEYLQHMLIYQEVTRFLLQIPQSKIQIAINEFNAKLASSPKAKKQAKAMGITPQVLQELIIMNMKIQKLKDNRLETLKHSKIESQENWMSQLKEKYQYKRLQRQGYLRLDRSSL